MIASASLAVVASVADASPLSIALKTTVYGISCIPVFVHMLAVALGSNATKAGYLRDQFEEQRGIGASGYRATRLARAPSRKPARYLTGADTGGRIGVTVFLGFSVPA